MVFVAWAAVPSVRVRLAGDVLAVHAIAALPIALKDGANMDRFVAGAGGLGVRYRPMPHFAMRLESYVAYAGKAHGVSIPMFLGGELWF
ncbi:MAG: hypothetical protein E6J91_29375 [Deltaproteobacteria bacterium]|nr:MAG: hypothetical protein E6J91_29375 [Deltaproteobacteria bacterium]